MGIEAIPEEPGSDISRKLSAALGLHGAGRLDEAQRLYAEVIAAHPDHAEAWHLRGVLAYQRGNFAAAVEDINKAITLSGQDAAHFSDLGLALLAQGRLADAVAALRRAVALRPGYADALFNLGNALYLLKQLDAAADAYRASVAAGPASVEALNNLGNVLRELGRAPEAEASYRQALALRPDLALLHNNLGNVLKAQRRMPEAMASYERALTLKPDFADAHNNLGNALQEQGRREEAIARHRRALALKPAFPDALNSLGTALQDAGRTEEAVAAFGQALALDANHVQARFNLALALQEQKQPEAAAAEYERVLALDPGHGEARLRLFNLRLHLCDWAALPAQSAEIKTRIAGGTLGAADPYFLIFVPGIDAREQRMAAETYAQRRFGPAQAARPEPVDRSPDRQLRVGYLSADFHEHATAYLLAEMIELHDRTQVEPIAYSLGPDDGSAMRRRLTAAFGRFCDLRALSFADAASRIHGDRVDILIDLKGYTGNARTEILALRPAPLQASFLGYPGTMGAGFIDYLIADRFICPPEQAGCYTEALAYLPDCYQPNDRTRPVASRAPSREAAGLPANGFVFCAFNGVYKITPAVFGIWMDLLKDVPGSVLWLVEAAPAAMANLRQAAAAAGVAPERLVFSPKLPLADHLARHALADLFLDTLPCSAHTTASDALWAGLPVLTCAGDTFAGRVSGSLVRAAGLSELVAADLDEYRRRARRLATQAGELAALRAKLARNRSACPLFDTPLLTRNLEALYRRMWRNLAAGRPPAPIA